MFIMPWHIFRKPQHKKSISVRFASWKRSRTTAAWFDTLRCQHQRVNWREHQGRTYQDLRARIDLNRKMYAYEISNCHTRDERETEEVLLSIFKFLSTTGPTVNGHFLHQMSNGSLEPWNDNTLRPSPTPPRYTQQRTCSRIYLRVSMAYENASTLLWQLCYVLARLYMNARVTRYVCAFSCESPCDSVFVYESESVSVRNRAHESSTLRDCSDTKVCVSGSTNYTLLFY